MLDSANMVSNRKCAKVVGGEKGNVTYIWSRNGPASSWIMTIERTDIAENIQRCVSPTGTENLIGRCEIVAISVVGA
jgi:hypothetical protein